MKIREIEKQSIYISYLIGYNENNEPIYTQPQKTKAQISQNIKGEVVTSANGVSDSYDLKLVFEYNSINKYINEHTRFWINISVNYQNYNYIVLKLGQWYDGIINVYLKSIELDWDSIWSYSKEYGFYEVQCFIDEENLTLKVPENSYFNEIVNDKIWVEKPNDEYETTGLYFIINKIKYKNYYIYILKSGEE